VGIAKGVGQSMIVGRIHVAPLKVCATHYLAPYIGIDPTFTIR
jgi:hypothetical protein